MLLIASWTLNVALGVAFILKTRYPQGFYPSQSRHAIEDPPHPPPSFDEEFDQSIRQFRSEIRESNQERRGYLVDLAEAFADNEIDTAIVRAIADSIESISSTIHHRQIQHLVKMHDKIPPHARRELVPRMLKRMDHPPRHFIRFRHSRNLEQP